MIRNIREAKYVQSMIDRLRIPDVVLMYDHEIEMWAVCQVRKKPKHILVMTDSNIANVESTLMFWIKNNDGTYRVPSDMDVSNVVAIVQRAEKVFDKGSDWMIDQIENSEKETYNKNREAQSKRIRDVAPALKRAIHKDVKEGRI